MSESATKTTGVMSTAPATRIAFSAIDSGSHGLSAKPAHAAATTRLTPATNRGIRDAPAR